MRPSTPLLAVWLALAPIGPAAHADDVLRVGTSGDYAPYSRLDGTRRSGFDVEVARHFAADTDRKLTFVAFRWPELSADLVAGRFDVAMSGVTVRPERSLVGRFSVPVAASGAVALLSGASTIESIPELDRVGVEISVNGGGHLERVARAHFPNARILATTRNDRVLPPLLAGEVDAAITDTREAPRWLAGHAGLRAIGPFTRDRKAYLVSADATGLARDLDAWLVAREADGSLARWREQWLGDAARPRTVLDALVAALDERLWLMPAVAEAKRAGGRAIAAPEREALVIDAGVTAVAAAASRSGLSPPDPTAVRALYRAQIEAAKAIQREVLAGPAGEPIGDLDALRAALLRIGEKIAELTVRLPSDDPRASVEAALTAGLTAPHLPAEATRPIASALEALRRAARPRTALAR